jgi:hypothetical protein
MKLGSPSLESDPESGSHRELRVEFSRCSGLLRLGTVLHSHSSGLLIHRSDHSHVRSGLDVKMAFGEVKIGVRVYGQESAGICQFSEGVPMFLVAEFHWEHVQVQIDSETTLWLSRVAEVLRHYDLPVAFC